MTRSLDQEHRKSHLIPLLILEPANGLEIYFRPFCAAIRKRSAFSLIKPVASA